MKQLILIFLFTLGLTTAAQAKKLWECEDISGEDRSTVTRFKTALEDKIVVMSDSGSVRQYHCNQDPYMDNEVNKKEFCVYEDAENKKSLMLWVKNKQSPMLWFQFLSYDKIKGPPPSVTFQDFIYFLNQDFQNDNSNWKYTLTDCKEF